jgi:hypothetical protein
MIRMRTPLDDDVLVGLIGQIYDAAVDAARWKPFLVSLAESIGGTAAHILHHDLSSSGSVSASARHDPEVLRLYNEHFHSLDVLAINPRALLLVDMAARVVLANRRGRAMLAARDGLSTQRGRIAAASPADTRRLRELCAAVTTTRDASARHSGGALRLHRPSGRLPLEAVVTPTSSNAFQGVAPVTRRCS